MNNKDPTIRERLAVVETEVKHINTTVKEFKQECKENFDQITTKLTAHNKTLTSIESSIDSKLQGSFTGKEKAMIISSIIAGVVSVISIVIKVFWG